jgi:DNA processing protein
MTRRMSGEMRILHEHEHPEGLDELERPPKRLWARGELPTRPAVAIVGTRRADREALAHTRAMARELAERGIAVVSGGAVGIDAAAHQGALDGGGRTFMVQAAPLDAPYPAANRALFFAMLEAGGGWLSETPPGQGAPAARFLARNRIVAALADVVVVVQAPVRSGALSTAAHAKALGRPLLVVPAAPWDPRGVGCVSLLREGATACATADDIAAALGMEPEKKKRRRAAKSQLPLDLEDEPRRVLDALGARPRHTDELARELGLSAPRLTIALVSLAARGLARPDGGGWRVG